MNRIDTTLIPAGVRAYPLFAGFLNGFNFIFRRHIIYPWQTTARTKNEKNQAAIPSPTAKPPSPPIRETRVETITAGINDSNANTVALFVILSPYRHIQGTHPGDVP
jgi:hypothetical protein